MKVLLINNCYPFGSTGKIVKVLENYYNKIGFETMVLYGHGEKTCDNHIKVTDECYMKIQALRRRITGIMYGGCYYSTRKIIRIIDKTKPDIVHLHCLNSNFVNIFMLITWLKKKHISTVLTNHAEFIYTANCGHAFDCQKYQTGCGKCPRLKKETKSLFFDATHKSWKKMLDAFSGFNSLFVTNVSPWLSGRASSSAILKNFPNFTVLNGIDTSVFYYRNNYSFKEEKTILHVTANFSDEKDDNKGGRYLIELAKKYTGRNINFIVAGKYPNEIEIPKNMKLLGNVNDQSQLANLYSEADVVVLTSQKETFSMITAESLCCGTPVVGFKAGAPELIAIPEYSDFVDYGDVEALYKAVNSILNISVNKATISKIAKEKYAMEKMANEYIDIYNQCLQK